MFGIEPICWLLVRMVSEPCKLSFGVVSCILFDEVDGFLFVDLSVEVAEEFFVSDGVKRVE